MTEGIEELRKEVESLRERVEELEDRMHMDQEQTASHGEYDRYDRYVLDRADGIVENHPRKVMRLYAEAGVRDKSKQKRRTKRLKRLEEEKNE